jgi:hypothetical protein
MENWIELTDDPSIAAIAFAEPATLGVRFQPAPWQKKKGIAGGEYHYSNVTGRDFQKFAAAPNKNEHFNTHFKNLPELYPYVKVEANPTEPQATTATSGVGESPMTSAKITVPSTPTIEPPTIEAEGVIESSPASAALVAIDDLPSDLLFTPGTVDDKLTLVREKYLADAAKLDTSTETKRKKLKSLAFELVKLRTSVEGRAKAHTIDTKRKLAQIDSEKRRICDIIQGIQDEVRKPLTEWENAEKFRVDGFSNVLAEINRMQPHTYPTIEALQAGIAKLGSLDPSKMEEFSQQISTAKEAALKALTEDFVKRNQAEADRRELEELRAKVNKPRVTKEAEAEYRSAETGEAERAHRAEIEQEVYAGLADLGLSIKNTGIVHAAIVAGKIPHLTIVY